MPTVDNPLQAMQQIVRDEAQKPPQQLSGPVFNVNGGTVNFMNGPVNLVMSCDPDGALKMLPLAVLGQAV